MVANSQKRSWQPREMQMVTEWLMKTHPGDRWQTRVRLGSPSPTSPNPEMSVEEKAMVGMWRRWADAVIFLADKLILVEAAIRPDPGKISQLELYEMLVPHTPELEPWKGLPIEKVLLYAIEDPATVHLARNKGVRAVEYKPDWLNDYMKLLMPRERRGSRFTES